MITCESPFTCPSLQRSHPMPNRDKRIETENRIVKKDDEGGGGGGGIERGA